MPGTGVSLEGSTGASESRVGRSLGPGSAVREDLLFTVCPLYHWKYFNELSVLPSKN